MITRAALAGVFGSGASQNINGLSFNIDPNWSAEAVLVSLLNNVLRPSVDPLQAEDGSYLISELGIPLTGRITNQTIEAEIWKIVLFNETRISKVFIGINEAI